MKTLHTIYTSFAKRTAIILTLLLTLGVTSVWGAEETLTITYGSFKTHTSSYTDQQWSTESSDGTSISGSATVYFANGQNYIQLKNSHPAFRNTTALPGALKSITLTRQATGSNRQITMYVSTSLITKDNYTSATSLGAKQVTTSGVTWTLTSNQQAAGYKYFYFHGSSNTCYLDNVVVTYAASCTNSVAVSAGSKTNVNSISFSSTSIATCSLNAADRQVTVTVTPNTGYEMTSSARLTFTKTSGTATATYVSGPTASGSSYQFVYQFNQNDNGEGAFSASCTAKTSTVSFNQNGGEGGTASVTATYGQNMPTPITLPTRYGHTFGGYYDGVGGTGTQYYTAEGASAKTWNKTSASATLYAKWTEKDLTNYRTTCSTQPSVSFDLNGGSGTFETVTLDGDSYTIPEIVPTRDGYNFVGWKIQDGNETVYKHGTNNATISNITESITLVAQWSAIEYTITYHLNGGSGVENTIYTIESNDITLPTPEQQGLTFVGWYENADFTGQAVTKILRGSTGNKEFWAKWEKSTPTFAWSDATCAAALEADNTFPTLNNPNTLPVTYTSSNTDVATIDANGNIILVATGTTTITATGAETATHKSATTAYTLTVNPSNCRWVEVKIGDIEPDDEVLVTMKTPQEGNTYTLDHSEGASTYPPAKLIEIVGNEATFLSTSHNNSIWNISGNATDGYILRPNGDSRNALYCTATKYYVRVGTGTDNLFTIDGGYLMNKKHSVYVGVYNSSDWRHYPANTGNAIANQTIKFYKRECLDATNYWVTWDAGEGAWEDKSSKKIESYTVGATITKPADPYREGYRFDGWSPEPTIMPAQNTTFTAKWTEVYKVTWYENGVPSYTYVPSDNAVVTWEDNIADCGEKKFYGWTADNTFVSDPTTPPSLISKGTTIAGDVTYYAVYADAEEPANSGYTKVTTISEGTYLIAAPSKNIAYKAVTSDVPAVISNNVISSLPEGATELLVELGTNTNAGYFAISYNNNGTKTYIYGADKSLSTTNTATYDWSLDADNATLGEIQSKSKSGYYIQANNTNGDFKAYAHTQTVAYLYKKQTTTYKNFAVSCATYTITVTSPTDGTLTTNPADEAGAGQEITINVTPNDCKYLTALKYNDGSDHSINIASTPYTFTMPAADVTVTATFADKNATDIEILTSAHRMLMQGSAFVGEQVRITYNNGDKETLNWNDSRLTFTGHNTATLGSQTVTVTYNDCGTQSASYNIEVIDGLGITFWDGDYTETIKYEPGDLVDVDNKMGQNICTGWEFAGWSETKVANESEEYVPVHNFNATDAKVLYAVYVKKKAQWTTIVTADEAKSGAKYVLAYDRYDTYYALTSSVKDVNYLAGKVVTSTEGELNSFDVYYLSAEPTADLIWELVSTGENGKWYLYNKNTAKYIDLSTQGQIHLTDLPSDKLQMESGYNDSQIRIASSTVPTYYLSWDNSNTRYNTYASSNSQEYWYTKDEEFTSTPPCSPLSATFYGNGGIVTDGIKSGDNLTIKEPTRDAGITTPTASFADCNGKSWTFVGWSREEIDVTCVPVLTTDLLHDGGGNKQYEIQEDGEDFWAVYTNIGNPETKYGTITFEPNDFPNTYNNTVLTITKKVNGDDYVFEHPSVASPTNQGIQLEEGKGYIKNITSLGKINSVSFSNFIDGSVNNLKVTVGKTADDINIELTEDDLQEINGVYTYYPKANYSFVKIASIAGTAVSIETISIDFGKGTQIWATTPDCSTITLSGDEIYVTAINGRAVMAPTTLTVKANQLEANADVILTSNNSDVYFSTDRTFNFAAGQAADQKPTTSLTLPTDAEGNLATTDVYIHYMPSREGNGVPADVVISANLETPNPSITDDHTIHVRNLPAKFVIATKVGATWYALPANMTEETNPLAEVIEVDETTMTATAPNTSTYTLWPVKTTNGTGNRYADYGDRLRFAAVNNEQRGLWANNNNSSSAIRNYAVINSLGADGLAGYEWKVTTTVVDGHWQYTLQTDQTQNQNYLRYWVGATGAPKWGTYAAGNNQLYFLPVTETEPFDYKVVEWYPTKMLIQTDATIANPTAEIGDAPINNVTCTNKGSKLYEIAGLPLESNPTKVLTIKFSDGGNNYTNATAIPVIISQSTTTVSSAPFTTLTKDVYNYADLVVRDGATLTIDGGAHADNTFYDVTIYPTAKISVPQGKQLSVHSLTFFGGIDDIYDGEKYTTNKYGVPQLSLKGTLGKTVTTMDYIMRVNLDQMYQVGVPYNVNLGKITYWDGSAIELGDELYVSAYDGQARANLDMNNTWRWEVNFAEKVLKAGVGYTISAEPQVENDDYSILRMPMESNISSGDTEASKQVPVIAYANQYSVQIAANHKGWNYLSNPYMTAISGGEADSELVLGYLKETGTGPWEWVNDEIRYVTIPHDDGEDYYQKKFSKAVLKPFKSFFVQIATDGELSFALTSRQNAPARYMEVQTEQEVEFEILLSNDKQSDNTGLLIAEQYSPVYEINADLEKMIGSMSVYTIYGGYKLAYNALSPINASEWIPMGYVAPAAGEYTFRLDDVENIAEQVEHVYIIDYNANNIVDLMDEEYKFTTDKEQNDNRFAINVVLVQDKDNTTTGMDIIHGNVAAPIKFIYHDKMYIQSGGVIYDGTGKQIININK